jgi:hypothetical protein
MRAASCEKEAKDLHSRLSVFSKDSETGVKKKR